MRRGWLESIAAAAMAERKRRAEEFDARIRELLR